MIKIRKIEFTTITNFVSKLQFNCQSKKSLSGQLENKAYPRAFKIAKL